MDSPWETECVCGGKKIYHFQGETLLQWGIISPTVLMCGLFPSYQSNYMREEHASYFGKQKQHHGASIDGYFDKYTFRLSEMLVNISGIADGVRSKVYWVQ